MLTDFSSVLTRDSSFQSLIGHSTALLSKEHGDYYFLPFLHQLLPSLQKKTVCIHTKIECFLHTSPYAKYFQWHIPLSIHNSILWYKFPQLLLMLLLMTLLIIPLVTACLNSFYTVKLINWT
ncbi:hypothetical protein MG293_015139 [Ovis ammon polii]|uniref:Uncharacterized protein n=1 Tax=Ovis ammon polii TaxID=230172 RepID=A0AAD4Y470_OVIAM|nr:hypothetical protein MG293_015139 [Ovis ammon polii]